MPFLHRVIAGFRCVSKGKESRNVRIEHAPDVPPDEYPAPSGQDRYSTDQTCKFVDWGEAARTAQDGELSQKVNEALAALKRDILLTIGEREIPECATTRIFPPGATPHRTTASD